MDRAPIVIVTVVGLAACGLAAASSSCHQRERDNEHAPPNVAPAFAEPKPKTRHNERAANCTTVGAQHLARAYRLATPMVNGTLDLRVEEGSELPIFVRERAQSFEVGGPGIACARLVARHHMAAALGTYDAQAVERALATGGPAELAQGVGNSLNQGALQMFSLAQELDWLARVLPPMSAGDLEPFNRADSPARVEAGKALTMFKMMPDANTPEFQQILRKAAARFEGASEESIVRAADVARRAPDATSR